MDKLAGSGPDGQRGGDARNWLKPKPMAESKKLIVSVMKSDDHGKAFTYWTEDAYSICTELVLFVRGFRSRLTCRGHLVACTLRTEHQYEASLEAYTLPCERGGANARGTGSVVQVGGGDGAVDA